MSNRLAIFDCDGTLVDSQANICMAMELAFERAGLAPPPREATRRVVGLSLVEAMETLLPEAGTDQHREMAEAYKQAFTGMRGAGTVHEPLYDGIVETITALDETGWLLGVATGKSDRGLKFVLEAHGLTDRFVTLHTADRHPSKPHPSMIDACMADAGASRESSVMIGDTTFDMAMARAANVMAVGVAWGYHDPDELEAAGADVVIDSAHDLAAIIEELA
ncbi:HAD-IA family hydrolase [Parasphingopyxis lamellibrachiae]|uniref:Phosphoglycolate phosphatase n=1 Tax=Parasphingopyxis lamellibrachiae TaxID=680125 RepID=A0A3D9FH91_9SPHN|nr:HAD-IA family hydrolase [Parasphingopyxis lamellibrachiae]RED16932.1 phosphoglycolate phosphatase [Parasphingopyxis lamellibrachiae]